MSPFRSTDRLRDAVAIATTVPRWSCSWGESSHAYTIICLPPHMQTWFDGPDATHFRPSTFVDGIRRLRCYVRRMKAIEIRWWQRTLQQLLPTQSLKVWVPGIPSPRDDLQVQFSAGPKDTCVSKNLMQMAMQPIWTNAALSLKVTSKLNQARQSSFFFPCRPFFAQSSGNNLRQLRLMCTGLMWINLCTRRNQPL